MKVLYLPLKGKWFDMIESGEKKEEYREIKPYWFNRFVRLSEKMDIEGICVRFMTENPNDVLQDILEYSSFHFNHFDAVCFSYGYTKRKMVFKLEKYGIGKGVTKWGAPDNNVFVLKLGERIK